MPKPFQRASAGDLDAARRAFLATGIGKAAAAQGMKSEAQKGAEIKAFLASLERTGGKPRLSPRLEALAQQVERYAKSGPSQRRALEKFLGALGPAGRALKAVFGPRVWQGPKAKAIDRETEAAVRFLKAMGYQVLPPRTLWSAQKLKEQASQAAAEYLAAQGYSVTPAEEAPGGRLGPPRGYPTTTKAGTPRKVYDVPRGLGGPSMRVGSTDPIITGEMIPVQSSNVHSIGYDLDTASMYVRFLAPAPKGQAKSGAGPLYRYHNVPPELFQRFRSAASKGTWVWDNVRIRGTVSGHRFDYALAGVTGNYVPRKATLSPRGEVFLKRRVRTLSGRWLESSLPDVLVRGLGPTPTSGPIGPNRPSRV